MIFIISFILAIGFTLIFQKKMIKNPGVFYIIFLLIGAVVAAIKIAGINFTGFFGEYIYPIFDKSALGTAFFVLVMFTGAFPGKSAARKKFLPIRRQLSIIACILTFGHNIAYGKTYFVMLFLSPASLPWYQLAAAICSLVMVLILIPHSDQNFNRNRIDSRGTGPWAWNTSFDCTGRRKYGCYR